ALSSPPMALLARASGDLSPVWSIFACLSSSRLWASAKAARAASTACFTADSSKGSSWSVIYVLLSVSCGPNVSSSLVYRLRWSPLGQCPRDEFGRLGDLGVGGWGGWVGPGGWDRLGVGEVVCLASSRR